MNIHSPIRTKLRCSKCGADGEMGCDCGVAFVRDANATSKANQAAEALRDPTNAAKSDRALAEELGMSQPTVSAARKRTIDKDLSVGEKRIGRDGKARKAKAGAGEDKTAKAREAVRSSIETNKPVSRERLAENTGVSVGTIQRAAYYERGFAEGRAAAQTEIDPTMLALSMTAQEKLEAAKRWIERKFKAEHAARMAQIDEEVRQRVLKEGREYRERLEQMTAEHYGWKQTYQTMTNDHKPIFTEAEYTDVLFCTHWDQRNALTEARANRAFNAIKNRKLQLTGKK